MLSSIYPLTKEKSLDEPVQSRDAFIYLERAMWVFGWTEPKDKRWKLCYKLWMIFATALINVLMPISMVAEYVHRFSSFSVDEFLSSLQICINIYGCSLKCAFINLGRPKFLKAKRVLDKLDESCQRNAEKKVVRRYVAWGNLCFAIYQILFSFSTVVNGLGYMFLGRHAWRMYFPHLSPDQNFLLTNFFECFLMGSVVAMELCTDVSALTYMLLGRCHIALLMTRLSRLRMNPEMSEDHHYLELTKCIQDHRLILDYFNVLRPVISRSIFVQFLLIGVVLGLSAINVMFFTTFWTGMGTCLFMLAVFLETFPFCHLCNVIIDDSQDLVDSLFHSNWVTSDRRYKTTLIYFLHNLQQPITLTAGGIFPICSQTNLAMVKLAFSVVTIIKQFNLAEMFQ